MKAELTAIAALPASATNSASAGLAAAAAPKIWPELETAPPPERRLRLVAEAAGAIRPDQRPLGLGFGGRQDANASPPVAPVAGRIEPPIPLYASLRVVGQIFAGYIVLEGGDGLILVDQHAAHERVTFERLRGELREGGIKTQAILTPAPLELNPARAAQVMNALSEFQAIGFAVEPFGPATLLVKGAPAVFGAASGLKLLSDMIESMSDSGFAYRSDNAFEDVLKQLACHGSVRAGRNLRQDEIAALLAELDRTEFKTNCPHGRPVHIKFPRGSIERMFRR
jgi:DNA mismatch repair protein MutL